MKKIFSTFLAVLGFSLLMAQTAEVPTGVKIAFKNAYKSTTVAWTTTPQYYVAKWEANSKHMVAYYAKTDVASLVRTESEVQLSELSTATQTSVKDRFLTNGSPYTVIRAFKIENSTETPEGVEFNMGNGSNNKISVFFDATGNMVKREVSQ